MMIWHGPDFPLALSAALHLFLFRSQGREHYQMAVTES
jgi:hypothetical protein